MSYWDHWSSPLDVNIVPLPGTVTEAQQLIESRWGKVMSLYWNPQEKLWYFSNRIFMLRPGVTWTWCWFFLPSDDSTGLPVVDPISIFTKGGIDEATFNACTVDIGLKDLISESST